MTRYVTETNIIPIVANTCDRLVRYFLLLSFLVLFLGCTYYAGISHPFSSLLTRSPSSLLLFANSISQTLAPHYREVCLELTKGKLLDDISWLAKVHSESVLRKAKAEQAFPDKLCEEIDWCKAYVDPVKLREKQAQETMEAVFF